MPGDGFHDESVHLENVISAEGLYSSQWGSAVLAAALNVIAPTYPATSGVPRLWGIFFKHMLYTYIHITYVSS